MSLSQILEPSERAPLLSTIRGLVSGKRKRGRPAKLKAVSTYEQESLTSSTSATDTDGPETPVNSPSPSTSAPTTTESSSLSMVWQTSPIGFVENGLTLNTHELLEALPELYRQVLTSLSDGRGEPVTVTVDEICRFLCEQESEYAEAPLPEAITYYLSVSQV